jgi:hypothetical protein
MGAWVDALAHRSWNGNTAVRIQQVSAALLALRSSASAGGYTNETPQKPSFRIANSSIIYLMRLLHVAVAVPW